MKRTITLLLALVLCFGLLSTTASAASLPFTDVAAGAYYYDPVAWAVEKEVTTGTSATTFSPDATCTRNQVVTFLWRAMGEPEPASTKNPFVDVKSTDYFYKAVLWAVEKGITNGVDATHFGPENSCTRAQVATFLWRTLGSKAPASTKHPFTDIDSKQYYYNAVLWAVENNVTNGMTATTFAPDATCTRGQIVTFLYRALKDYHEHDYKAVVTAATCTDKGYTTYTCACGDTYKDSETAALGHKWDKGVVTKEPTETAEGVKTYTCSVCKTTKTEFIPKLEPAVPPTNPTEAVDDLVIKSEPADVKLKVNEKATFKVEAEGGMPALSYQWQYKLDGGEFQNFTKDQNAWATGWDTNELTVQIAASDFAKHFTVRCVVTDIRGESITSNTATVIEKKDLAILTQPAAVNYIEDGGTLTLSVEVTGGTAPYTFKWLIHESGFEPFDVTTSYPSTTTVINEGNKSTMKMHISDNFLDEDRTFNCLITDAEGNKINSDDSVAKNVTAFTIKTQPVSEVINGGDIYGHGYGMGQVALIADHYIGLDGGVEPYTYEWQWRVKGDADWKDGTDVPVWDAPYGNTLNVAFKPEDLNKGVELRCLVGDAIGNKATSDIVTQTLAPMEITKQPEDPHKDPDMEYTERLVFDSGFKVTGGYLGFNEEYTFAWYYKKADSSQWYTCESGSIAYTFEDYDTKNLSIGYADVYNDKMKDWEFKCLVTDSMGHSVETDVVEIIFD